MTRTTWIGKGGPLAVVLAAACGGGAGAPDERPAGASSAGASVSVADPGDVATALLPAVVSTPALEFAVTFSPQGDRLYFTRMRPADSVFVIMESRRTARGWGTPAVASFSGEHHDADPFITPDGRRLFFMSRRPVDGSGRQDTYDLWWVDRTGSGWSEPRPVGAPIRTDHSEGFMSLTGDGVLYFASDRPGGLGGNDIWSAEPVGDGFGPPAPLPAGVNTRVSDSNPLITADGTCLVFYSAREGGAGRVDLYVAYRRSAGWSEPVSLGPGINTPEAENAPAFGPDRATFLFSRGGEILHVRTAAVPALRPCIDDAPQLAGSRPEPQLVQDGVISDPGRQETFPAIDPVDGSLWFSVAETSFADQRLFRARRGESGWLPAEPVPFSDGEHGDRAPRFSRAGGTLYFTSDRPVPGHDAGDMNIWAVERGGEGWGVPRPLPAPVNSPAPDIHASLADDGALYLATRREGGAGRSDLIVVPRRDGGWGPAEHLPAEINDSLSQPDVLVAPDGSWLIVAVTDHPLGLGGDDLFLTRRTARGWTPLEHFPAPINSAEYEYGPTLSPDGRWLYFTSHRRGSADVYRIPVAALGLDPAR